MISLRVEQKDVRPLDGRQTRSSFCPFALVLRRATKLHWIVRVDEQGEAQALTFPPEGGRIEVPLGERASKNVRLYDSSGQIEPMEFQFPWPECREATLSSARQKSEES